MNENTRSGAGVFLIELLLGLMIFALAAAVCVRIFAASALASQDSARYTQAVTLAQNAAELCRSGHTSVPQRWNGAGQQDEQGEFYVTVTQDAQEGELIDATAAVADANGKELFSLRFTYGGTKQ